MLLQTRQREEPVCSEGYYMKKQSGKGRLRVLLCLASLVAAVLCGNAFAAKETDTQTPEPSDGCVFIGVEGGYATDVGAVLYRLNEIRREACEEGVPDPRNPEKPLSVSDYVPIRWSADLEEAARIRAAEAKFIAGHERHNGLDIWTGFGNVFTSEEVIAWNAGNSMVAGVNQWYEEKNDWVNLADDSVAGHYTAMINPDNTYVGVAGFYSKEGIADLAIVGRFTRTTEALSEMPLPMAIDTIQRIEVKDEYISYVNPRIPSSVIVTSDAVIGTNCIFGREGVEFSVKYYGPLTYASGNTAIATVDTNGVIHGVKEGEVTVTVSLYGTELKTATVQVTPKRSISKASFHAPNPTVRYTGEEILNKPDKVMWNGTQLKEGVDYTVSYRDNIYPGKAAVIITGMGIYEGTKESTFTIIPIEIARAFSFGEVRAVLKDEIILQFLISTDASTYEEYTDADPYVEVSVNNAVRKKAYLKDAETIEWDHKQCYIIPVELNAKELSDDIRLIPYINPGVRNKAATSYSGKIYCNTVLNSRYTTEAEKEMVRALLTYSAYARVYLDYKADDVLNSDYATALPEKEEVINAIPGSIYLSDRSEETDFAGISLMLLSKVGMRYYFTTSQRVLAYGFWRISGDGKPYLEVPMKGLASLDQTTSTNIDGVGISASPLLYIKNVLTTSENTKLVNLCLAMYNLYTVARKYR